MRTTVDIDAHLLERVREDAERRGTSFKEALAAALRRGLESEPRSRGRKYSAPVHSMGAVAGEFDLDKAHALAAALDDAPRHPRHVRRRNSRSA